MAYNSNIPHVQVGYNPFTNQFTNFQQDIQVYKFPDTSPIWSYGIRKTYRGDSGLPSLEAYEINWELHSCKLT